MPRFVILILLSAPAAATADVVGPPPDSCPPGSEPSVAHSGPYCRPTAECTSDSACGAGNACTQVMQCIETRDCGGLAPPDAEPCTLEHVAGDCAADGSCTTGTCRARRVCTSGGGGGGGGCAVAPRPASFVVPGSMAALALALMLRRRP